MAKKMIIYGVILLLWLVACVVLYIFKLIDWIRYSGFVYLCCSTNLCGFV